jgi:hypothetical protein
MAQLLFWRDYRMGSMFRWSGYLDLYYGTDAWRFGGSCNHFCRRPELLVSSFTTENHVSIDLPKL